MTNTQTRDDAGKYAEKRKIGRAEKLAKRLWLMTAVIVVAIVLLGIGQASSLKVTNEVEAQSNGVDLDALKTDIKKEVLIDDLMDCERKDYIESDGLITIDNNSAGTLKGDDILSYGELQFKTKTVKYFVKLRDNKVVSSKEAKLLALDTTEARELAKYAIFEKGGIDNWHNCSVKLGLVARIAKINNPVK